MRLLQDGPLGLVGEHAEGDTGAVEPGLARRGGAGEAGPDVVLADRLAGGEDHEPLDDVAELPHVAGEAVARRGPPTAASVIVHVAAVVRARRQVEEVAREPRDVVAARAERGDGERHDVEAVVEIGAELPLLAGGHESRGWSRRRRARRP